MPFEPTPSLVHVVEEDGRTAVRFPAGTALTEANIEAVGCRLGDLAGGRERPHLTLDLGGVTMLTSVVLGTLVRLHRTFLAAGGRLALTNPTPIVRQVLRVTRLDTILDVRTEPESRAA